MSEQGLSCEIERAGWTPRDSGAERDIEGERDRGDCR
jgi:hypothetical protein